MIHSDEQLWHRAQDFMGIRRNCKLGEEFESAHSRKRQELSGISDALCGASELFGNIRPDGLFNDMLFLPRNQFQFTIAQGAERFQQAADAFGEYATAMGPLLSLSEGDAEQLLYILLGAAWEHFVEGQDLGAEIRISSDLLKAGTGDGDGDTDEGQDGDADEGQDDGDDDQGEDQEEDDDDDEGCPKREEACPPTPFLPRS